MSTTRVVERETYRGETEVHMVETSMPDIKGRMAADFAARFALAQAEPDGETSCGHQKMRVLTPVEAAKKACDLTEALWNEMATRGWTIDLPMPKSARPIKEARTATEVEAHVPGELVAPK